ncbi:DUF3054 domain-containing protein [Microbacterium hatanonis]|uniref:DUF3054 domain-containing protein n=1 Tax=Microbacterium hatanonis TaxID=404366 RepID=A0A5C8I414_9MICO|nr:DUF3054 domain-containing protein [Microbacterium hatanonis]TXK12774.1 DUF3054 domain-containing protein [Microbacterium hatanonis]
MTDRAPSGRGGQRRAGGALALDAVLVVAFAATGRATHDGDVWSGLAMTAWPFLAALVVGWLITRAWRAPSAPVRVGIGVWLTTVVGGMLLRALSGQGTAIAFVIVATATLFVALVGWRFVAALVRRSRAR